MKVYKKCQSCAMPMRKNEDRGTEKHSGYSSMYCIHCYQNGEFTQKNITVAEMKQLVKEKCIELGIPKIISSLFARNIHKLKRWK